MSSDNLILIGFMGTGKSTIGPLCAEMLGYEFCDTDSLIVETAGQSIPEIFAREGEEGFRARERSIVDSLSARRRQVIATGGGAILHEENAARLRAAGRIVGLKASPSTILQRVGDIASRPLLSSAHDTEAHIARLLAARSRVYAEHSHYCVETDHSSPRQIAEMVVDWYLGKGEAAELPGRIDVSLPGGRSYPIIIEDGMIAGGGAADRITEAVKCDRACIVTHPALLAKYAAPIRDRLQSRGVTVATVMTPAGERYKTLRTVSRLYSAFLDAGLDRKGVVIAVGGGVLGDTAGFAAATYLRGIRIVQAPTTLLAQVDSSVGGKTGVDIPAGKNLIGAFHQPSIVIIDPATLATLPPRELRSGLAEVIKYGIIHDADFFSETIRDLPALLRGERLSLRRAIERSCRIKADVVAQDETEQGMRAILNFGHTIGHALESITGYRRYKHGEAIAIGMVSASLIGEILGITPSSVTQAISQALVRAKLPFGFPPDIDSARILSAAKRDKKTESGRLRFVLAKAIGEVVVQSDVPESAVIAAIERHRLEV